MIKGERQAGRDGGETGREGGAWWDFFLSLSLSLSLPIVEIIPLIFCWFIC